MAHFGVLNVNKPVGRTSRSVVDRVERLVRPAKAGHAGTLDPLASGVLVVCIGQATRLIAYVQQMPKQYRAKFLLGLRSETDDTEGDVIRVADAPVPTLAEIEKVVPRFVGRITQVPPAHSAVKVAGRRSYALARAGKAVALSPRLVSIHCLTIRRYDYPQLELDIRCGSGTYIRALGRDLAAELRTSAVMAELTRTSIGAFHVDDALSLDELTATSVAEKMQPALVAVGNLRRISLDAAQLAELRYGRPILSDIRERTPGPADAEEYAAISPSGELAAIVREKRVGELWPTANFL